MTLDSTPSVGRRIECEGFRGTICFVGEIAGTGAGTWLGVDWDDETRGKHDGSHQGVRYFTARRPTSGSFVRPHKVHLGRLCHEAIEEQYEPLQQEKLDTMQREAVFRASKTQMKAFEFVGFEKILKKTSRHENLTSVDLRSQNIRGGDERLRQICANLEELNVRQNLFATWDNVASVTRHMPRLEILDVSQNKISPDFDPESLQEAFSSVHHLIAAQMDWECKDLLHISELFPELLSLQILDNNINTLDPKLCSLLPKLQKLDLDNNPIRNWSEILKISSMNSLEVLHLQNSEISDICFDDISNPFPALKCLILSGNKISNWSSVSALENIASLEELSFKNNPVLSSENFETNRQIIMCRVPQLKVLDKIAITDVERRGAALDYLKKYGAQYLKSKNDLALLQEFTTVHPCYDRLVQKFGAPEESELVVGSTKLKNLLITLHISCPQHSESFDKKVPRTMKVQRLRGMLQKLLMSGGAPLVLSYRCQDKKEITYEFDNDLKDLAFYSIQDGDEIIVSW